MHMQSVDKLQQSDKLSTGCLNLDGLLGGGLPTKLITEICGEAATGKTQFCLQLLLQAQLPKEKGGLDASSCYITTERMTATKRLGQLASCFQERHQMKEERWKASEMLERIYIQQAQDLDDKIDILQSRLPTLLDEHNVRLVVIDSIAALLRHEMLGSMSELTSRSKQMFSIANTMRILSTEYNVVFLVVNQVVGKPRDILPTPALGLAWSYCINQRIFFSRCGNKASGYANEDNPVFQATGQEIKTYRVVRKAQVSFSPYLPRRYTLFTIEATGIDSTRMISA